MSSSQKARVTRGPPPKKKIKRHRYAEVLPELMRDFEGRCAYSMQHCTRSGKLEVDHFDPRKKKDIHQQYDNLFPASRHCNSKKSDHWPSKIEASAGVRFLNPCREMDYGVQIKEVPGAHILVGLTPAARWHIRVCSLNADHLIDERRKRAKYLELLKNKSFIPRRNRRLDTTEEAKMIRAFREEVELMIPEILLLS
jgi:hypothetical protein